MSHDNSGGFATRQIHAGALEIPGISPLATPIFQTSTFVFDSTDQGASRFSGEEKGYIYTRLGNPNLAQVSAKLASLEGAEAALVMGSGIGAITTVLWTALSAGAHLLADETLYGCTHSYFTHGLTRYGVDVTLTNFTCLKSVKESLRPETKVVYFETPCNPDLKMIDIEAVSALVHAYNPQIKVIVDNTFCTPFIQKPLSLGADVVVHSATKYLNGHGDVIAGAAAGPEDFMNEVAMFGLKDMTGAVLSPIDAYLIARGLKTLDIRMIKHCQSAMKIAEFLQSHPAVKRVSYPGLASHPAHELAKKQMHNGFGGIVTFELYANRAQSGAFLNGLSLCTLAVSLGDAETLIEHPATMTHSVYSAEELASVGIGESMVRLSVGLEDAEDIIADLKQGLDKLI